MSYLVLLSLFDFSKVGLLRTFVTVFDLSARSEFNFRKTRLGETQTKPKLNITVPTFKSKLKTHLYACCYLGL